MKPFQLPAPRPQAVDLPLHRLEADLRAHLALKAARTAEGVAAEARHQMSPAEADIDDAFAHMACAHPEACSCTDDYPTWTPGGTK